MTNWWKPKHISSWNPSLCTLCTTPKGIIEVFITRWLENCHFTWVHVHVRTCTGQFLYLATFKIASPASAFWFVFTLLPTSACLPEDVTPFPPLSQSQPSLHDMHKLTSTRHASAPSQWFNGIFWFESILADGARSQKRKTKYVFVNI